MDKGYGIGSRFEVRGSRFEVRVIGREQAVERKAFCGTAISGQLSAIGKREKRVPSKDVIDFFSGARGREKVRTYTSGVTAAMWFELIGFGVGLLFGSFLNVCISRLPAHESIVRPGSRCMSCGHAVRWYDNVPVASWLVLRGRCRDCGAGISWRYPAVELAVALWFAIYFSEAYGVTSTWTTMDTLATWWAGHLIGLVGSLILGFLLIGLMVMDWRTQRLPDAFTLPGIGIGFVLACVRAMFLVPGEGDIVLNTSHQLRMSSPGSFQAQGNVFMTGTEAMVLGRIAAIEIGRASCRERV